MRAFRRPRSARCGRGWARWGSLLVLAWIATRPLAASSFEAEIQAFEAADRQSPPPPNSVLFIGSSSLRMWSSLAGDFPGFLVLNRGFGGSQASDVLYFYDRVVTPYRPPLIVYYEGDNDLVSGKSPAVVFTDWTNFVGRVERDLPGTGVAFLAVKPSPSRASYLGQQRTLNTMVQEYCRDRRLLRFVDVFTPMLNDSGQPRPELFGSDMLHMNAAGYALWRSLVEPVLEAWAAEHPVPSIRKPARTALLDFGGSTYPSQAGAEGVTAHWNNVDQSVTVTNLSPAPGGSVRIAITPGPANNNSHHFTYLGVLEIAAPSAVPTPAASALTEPAVQDRQVTFRISGAVNATSWIQGATAFEAWEDLEPVTLGESERVVTRFLPENPWCFYRAVAW